MYDVGSEMVSIVAYPSAAHGTGASTGPGAPAYLTVFGSTLSEMIVPIVHPQNGTVVGTDRCGKRAGKRIFGGRPKNCWKKARAPRCPGGLDDAKGRRVNTCADTQRWLLRKCRNSFIYDRPPIVTLIHR